MAIVNLTAMAALTDAADADVLYIVDDPGGSPLPRKITYQNLVRRAYGEIYVNDASTAQSLSAATWTKITAFTSNGISKNTTVSHANDKITVTDAGIYKVHVSASFGIGHPGDAQLGIYYNGSITSARTKRALVANDTANVGIDCLVDATSGATDFEVYAHLEDATTITVYNMNLIVVRIA